MAEQNCVISKFTSLHQLFEIIPQQYTRLYRYESLTIFQITNGHNSNHSRKTIVKVFQKHNLKIY